MKYYKLLLFVLLFIIILSLLYNHIYNVDEKFTGFKYSTQNQNQQNLDTIINHIILNKKSSSAQALPVNSNLLNCNDQVCLTNLRFNSEYPSN